ncbi:hypothetical protein [Thermanaerothrix daxensis]|uniref:hypothetical protein n=1 Tax=Thermanaerothrix daxensis TaxID=869279 RepID=UPI00128E9F03|nr:hypothetical protein [Thermanaerothrix daxensis]
MLFHIHGRNNEISVLALEGSQIPRDNFGLNALCLENLIWVVKENQGHLYQNLERLFAADPPKPRLGKIPTDFLQAETLNKGHERIEKRHIQTSAMLNNYLDWPGLGQVYRLERCFLWIRQGKVV